MLVSEIIAELEQREASLEARLIQDARGLWHFIVGEFHPDSKPISSVVPSSTASEFPSHDPESKTV